MGEIPYFLITGPCRCGCIGGICGCATCAAATEGSAATPSASAIIIFLIHSSWNPVDQEEYLTRTLWLDHERTNHLPRRPRTTL